MFRLIAIACFLVVGAGSALAQGVIYPPLVAGQYAMKIKSAAVTFDAEGIPEQPATASVGVFVVDDPGTLLEIGDAGARCVDMGPDELMPINVTVPAVGDRAKIKGRAYEGAGCIGQTSPDSPWPAVVYFVGPAAPGLSE